MTKHSLLLTLLVAFFFIATPFSTPRTLLAQDTPSQSQNISIGIVNIEGVQLQSLAFTSLRSQLETIQTAIQKQIKEKQEVIKKEQNEIEEQRLLLSNQTLTEKNEKIKKKLTELRTFAENKNRQLEKTYGEALLLIQSKLKESIEEVATQRKLTLVLNESNIPPTVLYTHTSLRIDEDVLEQLNLRISDITITPHTPTQNTSSTTQ